MSDSKQPNIIIIFADDLGYGDLGCYGSAVNATPNLDKLARQGLRFTDFYVASPVCSPSRAALMTGCYPKRIGLDSGENFDVLLPGDAIGLDSGEMTLPRLLKDAGYKTKIIGKWHLGDQPEFLPGRHGFDSYFGLPYSNDMLPDHPNNQQFRFPPLPLMEDDGISEIDPNQAALTDRYTAAAVRFIEEHAQSETPFFLYLAHMYVHDPIHTPMKYLSESQNGAYGAAVAHLDQSTGCILDTLAQYGLADNTLVIFTSDNGSNCRDGGSNAPLRGTKGTTWEGGMREPCIMRWPETIPANSECREISTTMDILPTLARFIGSTAADELVIDGKDISSLLKGEPGVQNIHEAFFYYGAGDHTLHAVRSGRWKLHLLREELYDLQKDPGESQNVFAMHSAVVSRLSDLAARCRQDLGDAYSNIRGAGCRPAGSVQDPQTLTQLDQMDPIIRAMYDIDDLA